MHNLAGKYRHGYGTPFDLSDLQDSSEIDLQNITHVRIVDVIGTIDPNYASYDAQGTIINDPYPTDFAAGGFDLEAVGVMHFEGEVGLTEQKNMISVYPNPVQSNTQLYFECPHKVGKIILYNTLGQPCIIQDGTHESIDIAVPKGVYQLRFISLSGQLLGSKRITVQ